MQARHKTERGQVAGFDLVGHRAKTALAPELLRRQTAQNQLPMVLANALGIGVGSLGGDQRDQQTVDRVGRAHEYAVDVDDEQTQQATARARATVRRRAAWTWTTSMPRS